MGAASVPIMGLLLAEPVFAAAEATEATGDGHGWTDVASALGSDVAAIAALATLAVAIVAARYAKGQVDSARGQLEEARTLRREQARPYVVVYAITRDNISPQLVDLVIENLGTTGAREVTITSSPTLVRTDSVGGSQEVALPEAMPFLAPRQLWRTYWDSAVARKDSGLPSRFEVTVAYTDTVGQRQQEVFILDWRIFVGRMFPTEKTVHHVGEALEGMADTLAAWSQQGDVVRVATYDGVEHDERLAREAAEAEATREECRQRYEDLKRRLLPGKAEEEQR